VVTLSIYRFVCHFWFDKLFVTTLAIKQINKIKVKSKERYMFLILQMELWVRFFILSPLIMMNILAHCLYSQTSNSLTTAHHIFILYARIFQSTEEKEIDKR